MKQRIITTLTVLLMTVMGVQAGVKIGNKDITADGTVSSTYIKSGSVSYNSATNTLTLNNATITINSGSGNAAIDFTTDGTLVARERKVTPDKKSAPAMDSKLTKQPMMPDRKLEPQVPKHHEKYEVM